MTWPAYMVGCLELRRSTNDWVIRTADLLAEGVRNWHDALATFARDPRHLERLSSTVGSLLLRMGTMENTMRELSVLRLPPAAMVVTRRARLQAVKPTKPSRLQAEPGRALARGLGGSAARLTFWEGRAETLRPRLWCS